MRHLRLSIVAALVIPVVAALVLLRFKSALHYFDAITSADLGLLVIATGFTMAAVLGLAVLWAYMLDALSGHQVRSGIKAFIYTWLGRYVPGTLPYHAARIMLAERLGTSKRIVTASIGYESILIVGSTAFIGVAGTLIGFGAHSGSPVLYLIAGLLLASLPLALHPRILVPATNRLLKITGRQPLASGSLLSAKQTMMLFCAYMSVYVLNGLSFLLITQGLHQHVNPFLAIGAYNLAGVIGTVVLFVPSGLGVREAALTALLSSVLAPEQALLAAGLARAVATLADVCVPSLLLVFDGARSIRVALPGLNRAQ